MYDITHVAALLYQLPHVLPDTLVTRQVAGTAGTLQTIAAVVSGLAAIAILVLTVVLITVAWKFRKTYEKVNDLLDRVYKDLSPLVRSASNVTEDAREIVSIVKGDVRQVQQTIAGANARLLKAVKDAEARLDEFNALIEVVQGEAESAFVDTASTVHGVRTGLAQVFDNTEDFEDGDDRYGRETGSADTDGPPRPRTTSRRRGGLA